MINKNNFFVVKRIKKVFKKAFTLIELVVVIAVIAILAGVSVAAYFGVTESANKAKLETEMKQVQTIFTTWSLLEYDEKIFMGSQTEGQLKSTQEYLIDFVIYNYEQGLNANLNFTLFDANNNPYFSEIGDATNGFSKVTFLLSSAGYYSTFEICFEKEEVGISKLSESISNDSLIDENEELKFGTEFNFSTLEVSEQIYKDINSVNKAVFGETVDLEKAMNYWMFNIDEEIDIKDLSNRLENGNLFVEVNILGTIKEYIIGKEIVLSPVEVSFGDDNKSTVVISEYKDEDGNSYKAGEKIKLKEDITFTLVGVGNEKEYYKLRNLSDNSKIVYFDDVYNAIEYTSNLAIDDTNKYLLSLKAGENVFSKNVSIPSDLILLIPANETFESAFDINNPYNRDISVTSDATSSYSKLVINPNVNLNVEGEVFVGGVNGEYLKGSYGEVENNGSITLENGSTLSTFGSIKGTGKIYAKEGSLVEEKMDVYDWPSLKNYVMSMLANFSLLQTVVDLGEMDSTSLLLYAGILQGNAVKNYGSLENIMADTEIFESIKKDFYAKQFPFNKFSFERIETNIYFENDASYQVIATVKVPKSEGEADLGAILGGITGDSTEFEPTEVVIPILNSEFRPISTTSLFDIESTENEYPIVKSFKNNKTVFEFNGEIKDVNAPVEIKYFEYSKDDLNTVFSMLFGDTFYPLNSSLFNLPLFGFEFNVSSGSILTLNNKYIFYPGGGINLDNSTLIVNETSQLNFLDYEYFTNENYKDINGNYVISGFNHNISQYFISETVEDAKISLKNNASLIVKSNKFDGIVEKDTTSKYEFNFDTLNNSFGYICVDFTDASERLSNSGQLNVIAKYPVLIIDENGNKTKYGANTQYKASDTSIDYVNLQKIETGLAYLHLLISTSFTQLIS